MNRQETFIPHICAPPCGKGDSLYRQGVENILGRREASRCLHVVVMAAKQKVRTEVKPRSLPGLAMFGGYVTRRPRHNSSFSRHGSISSTAKPGIAKWNGVVRYVQRA